ncbi:MAG: hypothetical protein M3Y23_07690, partial [Actinomycetota bacterium]|nr:hypothetical protein [Actinomycetota bacterium]
MKPSKSIAASAITLLLALSLVSSSMASSTLPGKNGKIAAVKSIAGGPERLGDFSKVGKFRKIVQTTGTFAGASYSPNGRFIVFSHSRDPGEAPFELLSINVSSKSRNYVGGGKGELTFSSINPNFVGGRIAYSASVWPDGQIERTYISTANGISTKY